MNRWRYGSFHIGSIDDSAKISFGTNVLYGHTSQTKQSDAFGSITGRNNEFHDSIFVSNDRDRVDSGYAKHNPATNLETDENA